MKPTWVLSDEERERRFRRTRERQHDDRNSLAEEDSLEFPVEAEDPLFNSNIRLKQSCPVDENDHLHRSASLTTAGEDGKIVASEKNVSLIEVEAFKKESLPLAPNETQRSGISQIKVIPTTGHSSTYVLVITVTKFPNNFCPSRFSEVCCPDFHVLQFPKVKSVQKIKRRFEQICVLKKMKMWKSRRNEIAQGTFQLRPGINSRA